MYMGEVHSVHTCTKITGKNVQTSKKLLEKCSDTYKNYWKNDQTRTKVKGREFKHAQKLLEERSNMHKNCWKNVQTCTKKKKTEKIF